MKNTISWSEKASDIKSSQQGTATCGPRRSLPTPLPIRALSDGRCPACPSGRVDATVFAVSLRKYGNRCPRLAYGHRGRSFKTVQDSCHRSQDTHSEQRPQQITGGARNEKAELEPPLPPAPRSAGRAAPPTFTREDRAAACWVSHAPTQLTARHRHSHSYGPPASQRALAPRRSGRRARG
jgi:hypothetical protein